MQHNRKKKQRRAKAIPAPLPSRNARLKEAARRGLPYLLVLVYIALTIPVALRHEPWRDEAYAWLLARDSANLMELFQAMGYHGSPALFHLLLYPFAQLGFPYATMFVIHSLLAAVGVWLVVRYAPFPWYVKVFYPFGFFVFYQYNIVARVYVLAMVLLPWAAILHPRRLERPLPYALTIFLLANVHVHIALFASVLAAQFFLDQCRRRFQPERGKAFAALAVMAAGFLAAAWQLRPPADLGVGAGWNLSLDRRVWTVITGALANAFPVPGRLGQGVWRPVIGTLLAVLGLLSLAGRPRAVCFYGGSLLLLWGLFHTKYEGVYWHHGVIFMAFIFSQWLAREPRAEAAWVRKNPWVRRALGPHTLSGLTALILALQIPQAWAAARADYLFPYSGGRSAARFLRQYNLIDDRTLVATYISYAPPSILPYIPNLTRAFYSLETETYMSDTRNTVTFNQHVHKMTSSQLIERMSQRISAGGYERLMFISALPVTDPDFMKIFNLVAVMPETGRAIMPYETFFFYLPKPTNQE